MKATTKKFVLTISTDADILDKYPNFRFNWDSPTEFMNYLVETIQMEGKDGEGKNSFGYSVTVEPVQ